MKHLSLIILCLGLAWPVFADTPVPANTSSEILREQQEQQEHAQLYNQAFKPSHSASIEGVPVPEQFKKSLKIKFYIKKINVHGWYGIFSVQEIRHITTPYEKKELSLSQIRLILGQLNMLYAQKGHITSFAYLPPQDLSKGTLIINIFNGKIGKINIKGNRYFSTRSLMKFSTLKNGDLFDYYPLKTYMDYLNRNPDRSARASIVSGAEPGTSDININVKDQLPVHIKYDYDNYGSNYIGRNEYHTTIWDSNLLGMDDTATYGYETTPDRQLVAWNLGYSLPVGTQNSFNFSVQHSQTHLGSNLKPLDVYGKSTSYAASWNRTILQTPTWTVHANLGFAYKNNYDLFLENYFNRGRDDLREITYGGDINHLDPWGRTYFNAAALTGIPDILGGLKAKDPQASVSGSGGEFTKSTLDLIRLQKLPFDNMLIWSTETQQSSATLPSAEQFQAGGVTNNRGYPAGDLVGDEGYSSSWNLAIPLYPVPRDWRIPFTQTTIYNGIKLVPFYDWSKVVTFKPVENVKKDQTLRSSGIGLQANISQILTWKIEYAVPLSQPASDKKKSRILMTVSTHF